MRSALIEQSWDLVLADWSLPRFSGLAALGVLKETGQDLPFIIVSGTVGEETAVAAIREGAEDYVLKDKLGRLVASIQRGLRDREERAARRLERNGCAARMPDSGRSSRRARTSSR